MSTGIVGGYHTYNILEALLATLNQLAQAPTLFAMGPAFGFYEECMSECINYFTYFLIKDTTELGKLEDLSQWAGLFAESTDAFSAKGMPFTNTALLIDGKLFKTGSSVDTEVEHGSFSYHHSANGTNFQMLGGAHGCIFGCFGAAGGRTPDANMYHTYDIAGQLEAADQRARQLFPLRDYSVNGFICFGDGAYPRGPNMLKGIIGPANAMEKEFNHACNKVRVAVEQIFHVLVSNFPYVDTARKMKIMLQPVALKVKCAVVFHNWHTCIYGNQISEYFGVCPPSLAQYLAL